VFGVSRHRRVCHPAVGYSNSVLDEVDQTVHPLTSS
jgi:hypothetical protein